MTDTKSLSMMTISHSDEINWCVKVKDVTDNTLVIEGRIIKSIEIEDHLILNAQEIKTLTKYLDHEYISYEDLELLAVVRKICTFTNE